MKPERIYKRLGGRIKSIRRHAGLSQADLAKKIGLTRVSVVNIEAGRQRINVHQVQQIARACETMPTKLLWGVW